MTKNERSTQTPETQIRREPTLETPRDQSLDSELRRMGTAKAPLPPTPDGLLASLLEEIPPSATLKKHADRTRTKTIKPSPQRTSWRLALVAASFLGLLAAGYSALHLATRGSTTELAAKTTGPDPGAVAEDRAGSLLEPSREHDDRDQVQPSKDLAVRIAARAEEIPAQTRMRLPGAPISKTTAGHPVEATAQSKAKANEGLLTKSNPATRPKQESVTTAKEQENRPPLVAEMERAGSRRKKSSSVAVNHATNSWAALTGSLQEQQWPDLQQVHDARRSLFVLLDQGELEAESRAHLESVALQVLDLLEPRTETSGAIGSDREPAIAAVQATESSTVTVAEQPTPSTQWRMLMNTIDEPQILVASAGDRKARQSRPQESAAPAATGAGSTAEELIRAVIESALDLLGSG